MKMENGDGKDGQGGDTGAEANTHALGATLALLKERTGRQEFSMEELQDPAGTLAKYGVKDTKPPAEKDIQ